MERDSVVIYDWGMTHVGDHIREAMERHGIDGPALAARLSVTPRAVYAQLQRDNATLVTLGRYAEALTAVLRDRGDLRRFTAESLQAGPDPLPANGAATGVDVEELARKVDAIYRGGLSGEESASGETLRVRCLDGVSCGSFDPTAEAPGVCWVCIPRHVAGAGATPDNTLVVIARGGSMIGADIREGAELTIRRDRQPRHRDIVVATVNGGNAVRRYLDTDAGPMLVSEGADGQTHEVKPVDGDGVVGVVVYIGRRPR